MSQSIDFEKRREFVFLLIVTVFLSAVIMINVIGVTRFISVGPFNLVLGVLSYPLTFLCTDLISELFGKSKANLVVTFGLIGNLVLLSFMSLGHVLPSVDASIQPPWQTLNLAQGLVLPNGTEVNGQVELYNILYTCTSSGLWASMLAYLAAQYLDVYLFHFWKRLTGGKHLWLRNNGSTMISQFFDTFIVTMVIYGPIIIQGTMSFGTVSQVFWSMYAFKLVAAAADTVPFYLLVAYLRKYLGLPQTKLVPSAPSSNMGVPSPQQVEL